MTTGPSPRFHRQALRVRVAPTEWAVDGSQSAAADLHLREGGWLLPEVQAKLMGDPAATGRSLANDRYQRMWCVVAGDKLNGAESILDRAPPGMRRRSTSPTPGLTSPPPSTSRTRPPRTGLLRRGRGT